MSTPRKAIEPFSIAYVDANLTPAAFTDYLNKMLEDDFEYVGLAPVNVHSARQDKVPLLFRLRRPT